MRKIRCVGICVLLSAALGTGTAAAQDSLIWQAGRMPGQLTDARFAQGVSASYAGVADTLVWWAGGCNFPGVPAAEGGPKVYYDVVLVSSRSGCGQEWRQVGRLPSPAAYGASVVLPDGLLCLGGQSAAGPLCAVFRLRLDRSGKGLLCDTLPSLPVPMDNLCAARVGSRVYVAGGNQSGRPSTAVYSLSLDCPSAGWRTEPPMPGNPRTQAVAVGLRRGGEWCLFVFGGFAAAAGGHSATLSTSSLCYVPSERRWHTVAAPAGTSGLPLSLGGGAGYAVNDTVALCLGGVDKDVFLAALRREEAAARAAREGDTAAVARYKAAAYRYMTQPPAAYRLNAFVLAYDAAADRWRIVAHAPQAARAGAAVAGQGRTFLWLNGELKPGVRTPEVWRGEWLDGSSRPR